MRTLIHALFDRNARWRLTHGILFRFGMGCLGLLFIAACLGALVLVNLVQVE